MIKEQFVSFDTAKMLKEAGFDVPCNSQYMQNGFRWDAGSSNKVNFNEYETVFSCPTQALAARWLREVYDIDVTVIPCEDGSYVYDILHEKKRIISSAPMKEGYEKVLEYGLFMAIKLIKK